MLKIFNDLSPFFEDNYRRINVREYARIRKISPPTASTILKTFKKEGLLSEESEKGYNYYFANKESKLFVDFCRAYWFLKIKNSGLLHFFEEELLNPVVILFGSLSKAEVHTNSDIDIAIISISKKELHLQKFQETLGKEIQLFFFRKKEEIKDKEFLNNLFNGYMLLGEW